MSKKAVEKFPNDVVFSSDVANAQSWFQQRVQTLQAQVEVGETTDIQMQTTLDNGGVYPTPYPWIKAALLVRDNNLIRSIKENFLLASTNCTVFQSTIRNVEIVDQALEITNLDVLGIISSQIILAGETVITDRTPAGVISNTERYEGCCGAFTPDQRINNPCCSVLYCSPECSQMALKSNNPFV